MEYVNSEQRNKLLKAAVIDGVFKLRGGDVSNKKFEFDLIENNSKLFRIAVESMARCINESLEFQNQEANESLALLTVGMGANRLGDPLTELLPVYHVPSYKHEGGFYIPEYTEGMTGIIVDDVYTTGTSFEKVKDQFRGRIIAAYALLDRSGKETPRLSENIPVYSVIQHRL